MNILCHSKTDARFMQNGRTSVWSIPSVSVDFFPSLKQNFIAYRSSKVSSCPDRIFEIHQLWQSGFSRVYSNSCCSCSLEPESIKIGLTSHKMYSNNIVNFQVSTPILNACKKSLETYWRHHVRPWRVVTFKIWLLVFKVSPSYHSFFMTLLFLRNLNVWEKYTFILRKSYIYSFKEFLKHSH